MGGTTIEKALSSAPPSEHSHENLINIEIICVSPQCKNHFWRTELKEPSAKCFFFVFFFHSLD